MYLINNTAQFTNVEKHFSIVVMTPILLYYFLNVFKLSGFIKLAQISHVTHKPSEKLKD